MTRSIYYIIIPVLSFLMLNGCAQRGDNHNPLGLTGGSDGGYGKRQSYYYESTIPQNDNSLEGIWSDTENTITLNSNSTFEIKSRENISTGTYSKVNDKLTLNFEDGLSVSYEYSLEKGRLTLTEVE
jgi:hypothetical protein